MVNVKSLIVTDIKHPVYTSLVTLSDHEQPLTKSVTMIQESLPETFSGSLLIDLALLNGNNNDRFIHMDIQNGKLVTQSVENITVDKHDELREISNHVLRNYPDLLKYSVLSSQQVRMLHQGISI